LICRVSSFIPLFNIFKTAQKFRGRITAENRN
jgi:hypothetical protein